MGSGSLAATVSKDAGKTWSPPAVIYQASPNKSDEHGARFPAVAANITGFHLIWIDAKGKERALYYSSNDLNGKQWTPPAVLDPQICACCWNVLKAGDAKLFALYRDICPSDMGLLTTSQHPDSPWTKATPPGGFNWTIDGCPHTGGALAITGGRKGPSTMYATVWTGKDNVTGGYLLKSEDHAKTWSDPILLGNPPAIAHHTTVAARRPALCVAYDAPIDPKTGQYAVFIAVGNPNDLPTLAKAGIQASPASAKATHPIALATPQAFLVFWTQQEEGKPATVQYKHIEVPK
jgi:hypothetical protein